MKIAWLAPIDKKCGIAFYAKHYVDVLKGKVAIVFCDPVEYVEDKRSFEIKISGCDCVHIQYETSLFAMHNTNFYRKLCDGIRCKKIVTVHEIYKNIPAVFPKERITGFAPIKKMKEFIWDKRHPHWAWYANHEKRGFFSDRIIVHSRFQKDILHDRGISAERISVIPHPIALRSKAISSQKNDDVLVLGATGFISDAYDYDLLIKALLRLPCPWKFIWIGGIRKPGNDDVLALLLNKIKSHNIQDKFIVTGWVENEEREARLSELSIYCALFKDRSSSGSLSDAIAGGKTIIATRIQLTEELNETAGLLELVDRDPNDIAKTIMAINDDATLTEKRKEAVDTYARQHSYDACAEKTIELYKKEILR